MTKRVGNTSSLLQAAPSFFILASSKRNTGKLTMLFSSALAARELAYMLCGDWDGLNAVTIYQPDAVAAKNALALLRLELGQEEAECCHAGEYCSVLLLPSIPLFATTPRSGKSVLTAEFLLLQEALEESIANRRTRST